MGQTRAQTLSDWKGLADAEAARNAVFAAMLARGGITGPAPIFEGRKGFFQLVSGPADVDVDAFGGHGAAFRINQCGMKAYPGRDLHPDRDRARPSRLPGRSAISIESRPSKSQPPARGYEQTGQRPREMGAGHEGHRRSQPALHHGARNVRRRHQQRQLRAGQNAAIRASSPSCARSLSMKIRRSPRGSATRCRPASPRSSRTGAASFARSTTYRGLSGGRWAGRRRAQIPRQYRQALAARADRCRTAALWALDQTDDLPACSANFRTAERCSMRRDGFARRMLAPDVDRKH